MQVVLSQSMYFPWLGFLEQIRLADAFVLYDDVQFSKGSFTNRVQIKTSTGVRWMTVPLLGLRLGQHIDAVQLDDRQDWRSRHRHQLAVAYRDAPFATEMLDLVDTVFSKPVATLSQLAYASTLALADYFGLSTHLRQYSASEMNIPGTGSQRVLDIVLAVGGTHYITGHGGRKYLKHQAFEEYGVTVRYMDYLRLPYPQLHGAFTPHVSALDLIANCGKGGIRYIQSTTTTWEKFVNESK